MSSKGETLAKQFEAETDALVSQVERLSDGAWRARTADEGWTVAATVRHIAASPPPLAMMVHAAATGGAMPPITEAGLDEMNAADATQFADCSRGDAIALLRQNAADAAAVVRALSDEQLARAGTLPFGMTMTAADIVTNVLIGHMAGHAASITAAARAGGVIA